jgi:endonuclease YncB( thermonuclease family)
VLYGERTNLLTARIIEGSVVSQPSPCPSTGETEVIPRTRIIIGGDSARNRKRDAQGVSIKGKPSVIDGDTLSMHGVDAVEGSLSSRYEGVSYPCGVMAIAYLVELTLRLDVVYPGMDKNKSGDLLVNCRVGKKDLNALMVASGWALANRTQFPPSLCVSALERAKESKAGLWCDEFVRP